MKRSLAVLITMVGMAQAVATHIVGAELYYTCTDSATHEYNLELKLYRDCFLGQAPYDPSIWLFIFEADSPQNLVQTVNIQVPPFTPEIQPNDWGPCVGVTPDICVEEGTYKLILNLPPLAGGYDIAWSRCCRNSAITNLANPLEEGVSYLAHVPDPGLADCNSMPIFDQVPPVFLCADQPFNFDHSATDPDGDSLVYLLTDPYTGTNFQGLGAGNPNVGGNPPVVDPVNNPMGPPNYNTVIFGPGYSFTDPFGSGNFNLDPTTGFISVTPNQVGIYVFAISVFEYRNGQLLSENRRDFQIHVLDCLPQGAPPEIDHDLTGTNHSNDTIFVEAGTAFCYDVTIQDSVVSDSLIGFTVSAEFGNGNVIPPVATFTSTGINPIQGQVCWTPACEYSGEVIPLVLGAYDNGDCENVGNGFDTVYIAVTPPPNSPPLITPDYTGLTLNGDTIVISAEDELCFDFTVNDPELDSLEVFPISPIFSDPDNPPTLTFSGTSPITGEICWTPDCDLEGQLVELTFGAQDFHVCADNLSDQSTIYVQIEIPPNDPPGINTDLNGNVFSNDTIFVFAQEDLCFDFTGTDPDIADDLTVFTIGGVFNGPAPPTLTVNGTNPLQGQLCWTPDCQYENQVVPLIFGVEDPGACSNIGQALDTVYVAVAVPPNDPPQIDHDLTGTVFSNDTIFTTALSSFCYTITADDPNGADLLNAFTVSPIFGLGNGPTFTPSGTNPVSGQVCWAPDCDFSGQTFNLIVGVGDDAECSAQANAFDTVVVVIAAPPNDPPAIAPDFGNLVSSGDSIFVDANEAFCFTLDFSDINLADSLIAFPVSPIFSGTNAADFTYTGVNPLIGQICWTPACENEGEVIPFVVGVEDNGNCENILQAFDTVYVVINDPITLPPIVGHDLSNLPNVAGDTIYIEINDDVCYEFFIADQSNSGGITYEHDFQNIFGLTLNLTDVNVIVRNDSILGEICFESDCSNGGSLYRSIITGIDEEPCPPFKTASDTVYIKVNTEFMSWAGADTFFCEGSGGVQLNVTPIGGTAPYYYQWYCSNPGNCGFSNGNGNIQNPVANPTDTTTYFVQVTDANGCTSEFDDVVVNVHKLPIADAGPDQEICEGTGGLNLFCTVINPLEAPGPYTYRWLPAAGLNDSTIVDPFATPDTTTIYTVIVTSTNGCSSDNTTLNPLSTIVVTVKESPVAEAGPELEVCEGDSAQLLGFANRAGPTYEYIWTPSHGLSDSSAQNPIASPDFTTNYTLVVWSNGCRSLGDSTTVVVHTTPTVNPGLNYEVCGGDSIQLNGVVGGDPDATEYSVSWSPPIGLDDPSSYFPMASPPASTTYTLRAESNFGCGSETQDVTVSVIPAPVPTVSPDTFLCEGDTLWLLGTHNIVGGPLPPNQPVFYEWSPPDGISDLFGATPYVVPDRNTIYTLAVSSGSCTNATAIQVDVLPKPQAIVAADTLLACEGDSIQLYGSGGQGNATYTWEPPLGLNNPMEPSPLAAPAVSTTYVLRVDEGICSDTASLTLSINPGPEIDYFASATEGCAELTVHFLENTQDATAYIWDLGDGTTVRNEAAPIHTYPNPGLYPVTLTAIGTGGCEASAQPLSIEVFEPGIAAATSLPEVGAGILPLPNAEVQFTDASTDAQSWFWDFGDGGFADQPNPTHVYQSPGSYTVTLTITDRGGCIDEYVLGPFEVAQPDVLIPNVFSPNQDGINDQFLVRYTGKESFYMEVFDRWGRQAFAGTTSPSQGWNGITPSGGEASEGVYYYLVRIGEQSYTGPLTLLR
ncbi:MAG: PKD domain-containing protein [Bacteroidota bacterium]